MESGGGPITIACCDNLQENGVMLEHCFIQYLNALNNEKLLNWVLENTSFPSSMVDRITPKIDLQELQEIQRMFNRQDDCSVFSEDFIQWVIEDNFAGIRPPLDEVGVEIVDDVEPYENTKIRILNGGHTVLAYLGVLEGYETFDSAIRDSELSDFFDGIQSEEIIPSLPINSPVDYERYLLTTKRRFENKHLPDFLSRICMDGATKFPIFLLPTIEWHLLKGVTPEYSIKAIASWYIFLCKVITNEISFEYIEPKWNLLKIFLADDKEESFASSEELWGSIPRVYPNFSKRLVEEIKVMKVRYKVNL
jgi:D-arabinitol 4-dehydrogenase